MDPWLVTPVERARHVEQFKSLGPMGGFVTGDQAKGFLLQSQLPPPILGQIWGLADMNCDGKMDINEFSVACKLITMKLKGFEVPAVLPSSLRNVLSGTGSTSITPVISPSSSGIISPTQMMPMRPIVPIVPQPSVGAPLMGPGMVMGGAAPLQMPGTVPQQNMIQMGMYPQVQMPAALPPTSLPLGYDPHVMMQHHQQQQPIAQVQGIPSQSRSMSITSQESVVSPLMEWAVPNPSRLKYTQLFNQNDRSKSGYLSGVQARNILMGTGLPQQILATVWMLSDLDADGRLSCEEFILAMHLCDVARQTGRLPPKLPADLIPPSFRTGSRKQSIKSGPGSIVLSGHNTGSNTPTSLDPEPLLSPGGTSFEDKRKMNYDKGQAELDRRRRVLEDAANREREERERKDREEFEKREKQRLEQERRKQEEIERQMAIQREMEERRIEEMQKAEEQKEAARKEMERQRKLEMEENKRLELLARLQKEQDEVLRLKGVNHGIGLELSQATDKVKELSSKITETRVGVSTVKSEIDGMRAKRDGFMNENASLKAQLKEQNNRMLHAAQEKIRLERLAVESDVKHINLKQLREKLNNLKDELSKKQSDADVAVNELDELKSTLSTVIESCKSIYEEYQDKREKVITMRKKHNAEFDYNVAWGAPIRSGSIHEPETPTREDGLQGPCYYRALYDFESRNPDELPFVAGAIIQRDDSIVPDPGWLAGVLDGKSGWFPESFVEIIPPDEAAALPMSAPSGPITQASVESQHYNASGGEYYVAMYPYNSPEAGDLPFEAGEIVLVSHMEGEWWTGSIGPDRVGIFPANYVAKQSEVATEDHNIGNDAAADDVLAPINNFTADFPAFGGMEGMGSKTELEPFEEAEIKREIGELAKGPPKSPKPVKTKKYEIATVLANYQANGEGQLTLTRGQLITVRKKSSSGWWEGELQSKGKKRELGWFPGSYAKILGPGGGSRQSSSRTTPIPFDDLIMPTTIAPIYTDSTKVEQMIALYPYAAQNTDELTFVKDDVITIISKDEPDWWRGQLGTAIGLFPVNYVQPLSEEPNNQYGDERRRYELDAHGNFGNNGGGGAFEEEEWDDDNYNYNANGDSQSQSGSGSFVQTPQPEYHDTTTLEADQFHNHQHETEYDVAFRDITWSNYSINMSFGPEESSRQEAIKELLKTEQNYIQDMMNVRKYFKDPIRESRTLTNDDICTIFVNWEELIDCSFKLLKAFKIRTDRSENKAILIVGDILCQHMPAMKVYIRFCSAQLRSAAFLQQKTETNPEFRELTRKLQGNPETKKLPLSSFLIKPMQRITRYPLLIKKILEHTPDTHSDRQNLEEALAKAEELCAQVNEGVREKENSDRLEWMQNHINCIGLEERLIFNSTTNSLGPRKFLHHGILKKTKSAKELLGLLFNDFLLLAQPTKSLNQTQFSFDRNRDHKFKIYRKPLFLNEMSVEEDGGLTDAEFTIRSDKKTYQMVVAAPSVTEKRLWVKSILEAQKSYHRVQQQYLQRQQSKKVKAIVGRLLVTVMEGTCLRCKDRSGKSDPYCEVSLGSEVRQTRVINGTLNPKWNDSMQFSVKDLSEDILSFTVYDKDYFSPDQFLGRTEIPISSIYATTRNQKMPWTKTFPLLEIESGEITIKLHLQIFEK